MHAAPLLTPSRAATSLSRGDQIIAAASGGLSGRSGSSSRASSHGAGGGEATRVSPWPPPPTLDDPPASIASAAPSAAHCAFFSFIFSTLRLWKRMPLCMLMMPAPMMPSEILDWNHMKTSCTQYGETIVSYPIRATA